MKKLFVILIALTLIFCGCGAEPALKDAVTEPAAEVPKETVPETTAPQGALIETPLFTIRYDDSLGWIPTPDKEFKALEDSCWYQLVIPNEDGDKNQAMLSVSVQVTDGTYYRSELHRCGFDPELAAAGGDYTTTPIGGYALYPGISYGDPMFFGRDVAAGMDITVVYYDRKDQNRPQDLFDGITFTLPDNGHVDPPFFSAGLPMQLEDHTVEAAGLTLTARQIPFTESRQVWDIFSQDMTLIGDKAYLLSEGRLFEFGYNGSSMTLLQEIPLEKDGYSRLESDPKGNLYVSGFMCPLLIFKDGELVSSNEGPDLVALAPDGTWGLNYFYGGDSMQKLSVSDLSLTDMPFPAEGVRVAIDSKYIFISGTAEVEGVPKGHTLQVFDHSGKLLHQLRKPENKVLGCITFACTTKTGFMGLDGNMRDLYFWDRNGEFLGEVDTEDIFGLSYPWLSAAELLPDGSLLVVAPQERPDNSGYELLIYQLSGF